MNKRCNQKFMFCNDRGIDFSVWLCRRYVQRLWGFPLCHLLDGKRSLSNGSTVIKN